jgi:glyoxylase-like metal-dependent hydrolase (beta-lactamase superfamily II)
VLRTHEHDQLQPKEPALLARLAAPMVQGTKRKGTHAGVDNEVLPFGHEMLRILATPGHTMACLSFAWRDRLFCGDLLGLNACPSQPIPAAPQALWDSVTRRIFTLPDETLLFAGHERQARAVRTVLEQRRWHPIFSGVSRDEFLARVAALPTSPQPGPVP